MGTRAPKALGFDDLEQRMWQTTAVTNRHWRAKADQTAKRKGTRLSTKLTGQADVPGIIVLGQEDSES